MLTSLVFDVGLRTFCVGTLLLYSRVGSLSGVWRKRNRHCDRYDLASS